MMTTRLSTAADLITYNECVQKITEHMLCCKKHCNQQNEHVYAFYNFQNTAIPSTSP